MTEKDKNNEAKDGIIPKEMAQLEWVWVLTSPMTKVSDAFFVLDIVEKTDAQKRRILPIFETREDAIKVKLKLIPSKSKQYAEHAVSLQDVGQFAAKNDVEIMMLDENGNILAHMEARIEQTTLH